MSRSTSIEQGMNMKQDYTKYLILIMFLLTSYMNLYQVNHHKDIMNKYVLLLEEQYDDCLSRVRSVELRPSQCDMLAEALKKVN